MKVGRFMLTIWENKGSSCCDGLSRRNFLRAGMLGLAGLSLGDVLRLRAQQPDVGVSRKSVIMIYLPGGPAHQDSYDMKPDAPVEVRGEFRPTRTNVPGMEICDLMPRQAQMADQFSIVRGIRFANDSHIADEVVT